jgi:hypothetical protein
LFAEQFQVAAANARTLAQTEDLNYQLWRAHGEGLLTDDAAAALAEAVEARRARIKGMRPPPLAKLPTARRRPVSSDRRASIDRRRRQAASGALPPALAAHFTLGEQAALSVVVREVQRSGRCEFCIDKIAALAGVCRSLVQGAVREARRLGLLRMTERRRRGAKSLTNVVEIVSVEWSAWIGFRKTNPTVTGLFPLSETTPGPMRSAPSRRATSAHMGAARPLIGNDGDGGNKQRHSTS